MNAHFPRGGLTDIADDIDWVSCDVFDTAVFRAVARPGDVFHLLERQQGIPGFARMRTRAARDARKAMAPRGEYSLSDVYERLPAKADMSQELDLELALARPNPEVQAFLRQAQSCGKKIAFTTDMYLPREAIAALLKSADTSMMPCWCRPRMGNPRRRVRGLPEIFWVVRTIGCCISATG